MREVHRRISIQPRGLLRRTADGRLRPASEEQEISDIWAEQKRIQLNEAIESDRRKAAKKAARAAKEFEIKISMPHISLRPLLGHARKLWQSQLLRTHKKVVASAAVVLILLFVLPTAYSMIAGGSSSKDKKAPPSHGVAGAGVVVGGGHPEFKTLLPQGKKIDDLGGWTRVSPATSDPVFAFRDMVGSTGVIVSEQELPASFRGDVDGSVSRLAQQSGSTHKIDAIGTSVYIAASSKGESQSVFAVKSDVLILMRSTANVNDDGWRDYVVSLD